MISAPLFPETSQTVVIGASSTQSTATAMTSYFVRLNLRHRLLRCRWHQSHGDHQQPAAVAGVAKVFCDSSGDKIAVIQKTGAGVLTISEMDKAATTPQTYTGYPAPELRTISNA